MTELKYAVVYAIDFFDDRVLGHRCFRLCQWIGAHPWWSGE